MQHNMDNRMCLESTIEHNTRELNVVVCRVIQRAVAHTDTSFLVSSL